MDLSQNELMGIMFAVMAGFLAVVLNRRIKRLPEIVQERIWAYISILGWGALVVAMNESTGFWPVMLRAEPEEINRLYGPIFWAGIAFASIWQHMKTLVQSDQTEKTNVQAETNDQS